MKGEVDMSETTYFNNEKYNKKQRKYLNMLSNKKESKIMKQLHDMPNFQRMKIVEAAVLYEQMEQANYEIIMSKLYNAYNMLFTVGNSQVHKDWVALWESLRASNLVFMHDILCSHHRPEIIRMARNMAQASYLSELDDENNLLPW